MRTLAIACLAASAASRMAASGWVTAIRSTRFAVLPSAAIASSYASSRSSAGSPPDFTTSISPRALSAAVSPARDISAGFEVARLAATESVTSPHPIAAGGPAPRRWRRGSGPMV